MKYCKSCAHRETDDAANFCLACGWSAFTRYYSEVPWDAILANENNCNILRTQGIALTDPVNETHPIAPPRARKRTS